MKVSTDGIVEVIKYYSRRVNHELDAYLTIFGCLNSFNNDISRIAVEGIPSSSDSRRIRFRATIVSDILSFALYTCPYVPSPIFSKRWYLSISRKFNSASFSSSAVPSQFESPLFYKQRHLLVSPLSTRTSSTARFSRRRPLILLISPKAKTTTGGRIL